MPGTVASFELSAAACFGAGFAALAIAGRAAAGFWAAFFVECVLFTGLLPTAGCSSQRSGLIQGTGLTSCCAAMETENSDAAARSKLLARTDFLTKFISSSPSYWALLDCGQYWAKASKRKDHRGNGRAILDIVLKNESNLICLSSWPAVSRAFTGLYD